jgi:hypothetical protein
VTNPLLSGISFPIHTCGGGYTRTAKVETIARHEVVRTHVRVCWEKLGNGLNCGVCEKCVRTRLEFWLAGYREIPAFAGVLTADTVANILIRNKDQRRFLQDILAHPRAAIFDGNVRDALKRVARSDGGGGSRGAIGGLFRKARSALRELL